MPASFDLTPKHARTGTSSQTVESETTSANPEMQIVCHALSVTHRYATRAEGRHSLDSARIPFDAALGHGPPHSGRVPKQRNAAGAGKESESPHTCRDISRRGHELPKWACEGGAATLPETPTAMHENAAPYEPEFSGAKNLCHTRTTVVAATKSPRQLKSPHYGRTSSPDRALGLTFPVKMATG